MRRLSIIAITVLLSLQGCAALIERKTTLAAIPHDVAVTDPVFKRTLRVLIGPQFTSGNEITTLVNGDRILPAMLRAIGAAQHSVNFESYITLQGATGRAFGR